jgi:hypothetical protein
MVVDDTLDFSQLPHMLQTYFNETRVVMTQVAYWLWQLITSVDKSNMAIVGLGQVWMQDTRNKDTTLMTKLMIALVWLRDINPKDKQ